MADNSEKSRFYIDNSVWRIDMQKHFFDIMEIQNRRFMYNPDTCTFILGRQYGQSNKIESSHAEEHFLAGASEPFDSFIRGWIGTGGPYKHGIIHFAPNIDGKNPDIFVDAYNTLQMFRENGASADTVIRGFGKAWEQPLSNVLPGFTEQTKGEDLINMPMTELKQQLLLQELAKIGFTEAYYIPESDNIKVQPDNDRMPFIRGDDMIFYGTEYDSLVQETIKPLINKVNDMIAGRETPQYYGVWAVRSAASVAGAAEAWSKRDGVPEVFTSKAEAEAQAGQYNKNTASANVHYYVKEMEPELAKSALLDMEKAASLRERAVMLDVIGQFEKSRHMSDHNRMTWFHNDFGEFRAKPGITDEQIAARYGEVLEMKLEREYKRSAEAVPDNVHGYEVKQAVCFSNDRGFALAESPRAVTPFVTWQFTDENGKREYYWGHYFAKAESAEKDYGKRVDEYKADYPTLTEKYNYLAAAEMSTEQNYNMLDGRINNVAAARADLTDGQTYAEIKELAPETLPDEKPSVVEKLAAAKAEAAKQAAPHKSEPHKSKEAEL